MAEDDDDNDRPPFQWGDFGALVLAGGFSLFGLYLIADMMMGGHPLAILFQKPKEEPVAQRPLTQDEIRKIPFHAEPGEVVLSTNAPLPGMGGAAAFPDIKDWTSLRITLSRSLCYGTCPSYSVQISGDGKVVYHGQDCVAETGERTRQIARADVGRLVQRFRDAGYFTLRDHYASDITDHPTYATSIGFDGKSKSVGDYAGGAAGMPQAVSDLEDAIDKTAGTEPWVYGTKRSCGARVVDDSWRKTKR